MPKNIILLSDGTGNSSGKLSRTNVWRLYQALDLSTAPGQKKQIAYYDDGVGTASFKPLALLGGITGWGLKRNVLDLYTFLCRHYEPGDQIYCFGFSRGAFTIRVLTGLIGNQGLVQPETKTEAELQGLAKQAFRAYRQCYGRNIIKPLRLLRDGLLRLLPWRKGYRALAKTKLLAAELPPVDDEQVYDANKKNIQPASYFATPDQGYPENEPEKRYLEIRFLGLWDTVAAYGLPFDELTRAWDFLFPLSFPDRNLGSIINNACHALALDDERHSFHPELWNENEEDYSQEEGYWQRPLDERLKQVWFAGMHSNLGGGYPDDGLAHVALNWIMGEAQEKADAAGNKTGLRFIPSECLRLQATADTDGKMYDSRRGLGGAYRYLPRNLEDLLNEGITDEKIKETLGPRRDQLAPEKLKAVIRKKRKKNRVIIETPKIHESVFSRINNPVGGYAPIGLSEDYEVYPSPPTAGLPLYEEPDKQKRVYRQEKVWNLVWWKRWVYFITVTLSVWLAALPFYPSDMYSWESGFRFLTPVIRSLGTFLPDFVSPWLEAYQNHPGLFAAIVFLLLVFLKIGAKIQRKIFDTMGTIFKTPNEAANEPTDIIYKLRKSEAYKKTFKFMKEKLIPIAILCVVALSIIRGGIIMDSFGLFSTPTPVNELQELKVGEFVIKDNQFSNKSVCWASGVKVEKNKRYQIMLTINGDNQEKWKDRQTESSINGFGWESMNWQRVLAYPLRRKLTGLWFKPIARIGDRGTDDYVLEPLRESNDKTLIAEIKARRSGELFLFVDDALLPVGQGWQTFYNNNEGKATVSIKLLD